MLEMRLTVVAVRGSCGQAEIWSAGSKHQFTALKAAPGDQTGGRGQTRQGSSTSADGHAHPGNHAATGTAGSGTPTVPRARQRTQARYGGPARVNFHATRRPQGHLRLVERFARFCLELSAEKTRLVEFGRFAAQNRRRRGLGRPETFSFLGFTHMCGKTRAGRFALRRKTIAKRMAAKLREVNALLMQRRHWPIPEQGQWLGSVVRGYVAYYAVPGNIHAVSAFRKQVTRHWGRALRRRSQRHRVTWERMGRIEARWLPPARITHPWPNVRFDARTQGRSPVR